MLGKLVFPGNTALSIEKQLSLLFHKGNHWIMFAAYYRVSDRTKALAYVRKLPTIYYVVPPVRRYS